MKGFTGHVVDFLTLHVNICLAFGQVGVELVDFVESANLPLFVVDDVFLFFLDVVDSGLDLGSQILLQHLKVVLLLFVLDPGHRLLFLFQNVHLLCRQFRLGAASE